MSQYTQAQLELKAHIEAENEKFDRECRESGAQWWSQTTTDLDFWADVDVYTVADYIRSGLIGAISDTSKDLNGFRMRLDWSEYTDEQLKSILDDLYKQHERELEWEKEQQRKAEKAHQERKRLNRYRPNCPFADLKKMMQEQS